MDYLGQRKRASHAKIKKSEFSFFPPHKEKQRVRSDIISSFSVRGLL